MPIHRPEYFEHGVYHIYNRGVAKMPTFLCTDDYRDFQDILRYLLIGFLTQKDAILPLPINNSNLPVTYKADPLSNGLFRPLLDLIAYCLMPNHFHLLIQIKVPIAEIKQDGRRIASFWSVSEFMRRLCITYSHKFNRRSKREGVVFQGRFKIKHIPKDSDVLQVSRYIHMNPVIAGLVTKPEQWLFSDYHAYILPQDLPSHSVTNTDLLLSFFNRSSQRYKEFVDGVISEQEGKIVGKYIVDQDQEQA
ncbi:hypothetical protein HY948_05405 [Candidatus Gottesmanbacteria bacterium]|nr:hypothetical protein [Candidatus Gottesmanbacteria bacterium]